MSRAADAAHSGRLRASRRTSISGKNLVVCGKAFRLLARIHSHVSAGSRNEDYSPNHPGVRSAIEKSTRPQVLRYRRHSTTSVRGLQITIEQTGLLLHDEVHRTCQRFGIWVQGGRPDIHTEWMPFARQCRVSSPTTSRKRSIC